MWWYSGITYIVGDGLIPWEIFISCTVECMNSYNI